jgi:hypothetical protein
MPPGQLMTEVELPKRRVSNISQTMANSVPIMNQPLLYKAKAVPLHATQTLGVRGVAPAHSRPLH